MSTDWSDPNSDPVGDVARLAERYRNAPPPPLSTEEVEHRGIVELLNAEQERSERLLEPVFDHLHQEALRKRREQDS